MNLKRSKGFEGMAASPDGKFLYPLLEGPVWDEDAGAWETRDGKTVLRVLEFSVADEKWTGRSWFYPLEGSSHAIGDFNMIDAKAGLVIERDNGEGTPDKACAPAAKDTAACFSNLPAFKRVDKIAFPDGEADQAPRKIAYIDLLKIEDPKGIARKPLTGGVLQFPFFTIENVDADAKHIVVGNDNNFPFSSSREPNRQDDNELVLLRVEQLLNSRRRR